MKKNILLAAPAAFALIVLGLPTLAHAQHYDSNETYDWSGPYAGAHVGGVWGFFGGNAGGSDSNVQGGLQGGYNWQSGPWVYGGEADFSWTSLGDDPTAAGHYNENWTSTIRGRVGYAMNQFLPYFTAGLGLTNTDFYPSSGGSQEDTHPGYVLGGGLEYMAFRHTSLQLQYLHVDVPNQTDNYGGTSFNGGSGNDILTAGFNYHFD